MSTEYEEWEWLDLDRSWWLGYEIIKEELKQGKPLPKYLFREKAEDNDSN